MFVNTIIASIPDTFWPTINTLVVVHTHAKEKLQPPKLIAVIHAKVLYVKKGKQKKESAHYAGSSNRGKGSFRGRGNSRGSRPRGKGRSGGSSRADSNCYNCGGRGHWGNECPSPKQTQANQAKEQKPSSKEHKGNKCKSDGNWRDRPKAKEVASSSTIEEVPESSWAAVEVPSKKGNLVFDFSDFQIENDAEEGVGNDVEEPADDDIEQDVDLATQDHANAAANSHGAILFDSGCSTHMTPLGDLLRNQKGIPTRAIQAVNGENFTSNASRTLHLELPTGKNTRMLILHNTLYCPGTPNTLVSLGKLDDTGYEMWTTKGVLSIKDCQGNLIGSIPKINSLYQIPSWEHAYATTVDRLVLLYEAHCMSGHQNYAYVKHMFNNNQVRGIQLDPK